nr:unnamed protein product [Callosobruchus chinensis]
METSTSTEKDSPASMYLHLATALKCLQAWISLGRAPFMMPVFGPILQSNQLSAEIKFLLFS